MRRLACLLIAACNPQRAPVTPTSAPTKSRPAPPLLVAPPHTKDLEAFIADAAPVIVLQHVHLIDGTGAPGTDDQTIVIDGGRIRAVGDARTPVPSGAHVVDGTGKSVFPGLVDMHAHL